MSYTITELALAITEAMKPFLADKPLVTAKVIESVTGAVEGTCDTVEEDKSYHDGFSFFTLWALSSCKDFYLPWNEEIHSSSKKVTQTGQFAKFKGLDKDIFIKKEGAWLDLHGVDASTHELNEQGIPVEIEVGEKVVVAKDKPTRKAPPVSSDDKPARPSRRTPPAKEDDFQAKALVHINNIIDKHSVDYDFIVDQILSPFDVDSFEELPTENEKEVFEAVEHWDGLLTSAIGVQTTLSRLDDVYGDELMADYDDMLPNGPQGTAISDLKKVLPDLVAFKHEWTKYYETQA